MKETPRFRQREQEKFRIEGKKLISQGYQFIDCYYKLNNIAEKRCKERIADLMRTGHSIQTYEDDKTIYIYGKEHAPEKKDIVFEQIDYLKNLFKKALKRNKK